MIRQTLIVISSCLSLIHRMKLITKVLVALAVLGIGLSIGALLLNKVPISDPPGWKTRLLIYFTRNTVETDASSALPELRPTTVTIPPAALFKITREAVVDLGWQITSIDSTRMTLDVIVTTSLLRFKDDIKIRIVAVSNDRSSLHIRSQSRIGRADYGANLGHILTLQRKIEAILKRSQP